MKKITIAVVAAVFLFATAAYAGLHSAQADKYFTKKCDKDKVSDVTAALCELRDRIATIEPSTSLKVVDDNGDDVGLLIDIGSLRTRGPLDWRVWDNTLELVLEGNPSTIGTFGPATKRVTPLFYLESDCSGLPYLVSSDPYSPYHFLELDPSNPHGWDFVRISDWSDFLPGPHALLSKFGGGVCTNINDVTSTPAVVLTEEAVIPSYVRPLRIVQE